MRADQKYRSQAQKTASHSLSLSLSRDANLHAVGLGLYRVTPRERGSRTVTLNDGASPPWSLPTVSVCVLIRQHSLPRRELFRPEPIGSAGEVQLSTGRIYHRYTERSVRNRFCAVLYLLPQRSRITSRVSYIYIYNNTYTERYIYQR